MRGDFDALRVRRPEMHRILGGRATTRSPSENRFFNGLRAAAKAAARF